MPIPLPFLKQTLRIVRMPDGDWITTDEAASLTGYDRTHVSRLAIQGRIIAKKYGRDWMIDRESLLAYKASVQPPESNKRGPKGR